MPTPSAVPAAAPSPARSMSPLTDVSLSPMPIDHPILSDASSIKYFPHNPAAVVTPKKARARKVQNDPQMMSAATSNADKQEGKAEGKGKGKERATDSRTPAVTTTTATKEKAPLKKGKAAAITTRNTAKQTVTFNIPESLGAEDEDQDQELYAIEKAKKGTAAIKKTKTTLAIEKAATTAAKKEKATAPVGPSNGDGDGNSDKDAPTAAKNRGGKGRGKTLEKLGGKEHATTGRASQTRSKAA
ncbi:hypothetical protein DXG01_006792 [Tephrocybe rancida]|nr:hypothetical protein DXG01_006792 [Tephrocybe rancida]